MKIAFVTTYDARDPSIWAGSTFNMAQALERQGIELHYIGPLHEKWGMFYKGMQVLNQKLLGRALHRDREPVILRGYAEQVERQLREETVDLVLSPGSIPIAHLKTNLPIVMWTDATYDAIVREYIWEPKASRRSLRLGHEMEARALRNCAQAIFTSDWAARSAIEEFGTDPAKVSVVPFGANIEVKRTQQDIERMIQSRPRDRCRLLFIGVGWQRKGGDIAVEVARRLNARGFPTELIVLGKGAPPPESLPDFVKVMGFIDKRTQAGREQFDELFGSSHFLLLPARAEAFGVVLCEACSFGVPCLAGRVGGIPTIIRDGVNGQLFPREGDPDEYARYALELLRDSPRYRNLSLGAFDEYQTRLNWDVAGRTVRGLLESLLDRHGISG